MTFVPNPGQKKSIQYQHTGHCEDEFCCNFHASSCIPHCPKTRVNPKEHCESTRKRCSVCKSSFIDATRSVCDTCMITEDMIDCYGCGVEVSKSSTWVAQAKAYLCTSCQSLHCRSCGRADQTLNIEGFCYDCADDYDKKSYCVRCGEYKYVHTSTEVCHACEDNLFG